MWSARRAMMIPFVGLILCDVNYIVQSANMDWSPYWLLVSDLLFGVAGGFTAIIGLLFAYSVRVSHFLNINFINILFRV
jgi:hypothetical protein